MRRLCRLLRYVRLFYEPVVPMVSSVLGFGVSLVLGAFVVAVTYKYSHSEVSAVVGGYLVYVLGLGFLVEYVGVVSRVTRRCEGLTPLGRITSAMAVASSVLLAVVGALFLMDIYHAALVDVDLGKIISLLQSLSPAISAFALIACIATILFTGICNVLKDVHFQR